jgi:NodT family efflux transporter outer membrane factor (OMF) lipoprotein
LSSSYSVDLFGATAARYRSSIASFINTKWDADLARINLAAQVARAYFQLLNAKSNLDVQRQNLETAEELLRIVEVRSREGLVNEFDLLQQQTQVQQNRTNIIQPEIAVRQAETALGLLIGRTPQEFHIEAEPIANLAVPEVAPWLPGELLARRPDIASSETELVQAKISVYTARTSLIPVTMTLTANGSTSSQELLTLTDTRNFSLQGALSVATGILNYRQRRNTYLTAKSNEYLSLVSYANTIRTALKEVDDNLANAEAAQRSEISQQLTLDTAQRSLDLVTIQQREGTASQEQLLNAQRTLFQAKESLARQRVSRLTSAVTLYVSLGGGWEGPSASDLEMMQPKK